MNRLSRLPALIVYLGMLNFLLLFVITLFMGGDGAARIEAGRYYLGGAEVPYLIYLGGWVHGLTLLISWPFVMIASLITWTGCGTARNDKTMRAVNLSHAFGIVESFFSLLFDSWRKPDLEFFTRLAEPECIQKLVRMPSWMACDSPNKKTLNLVWGGHHFEVSRYARFAWSTGGLSLTLHGHFYFTPHGTYLKAWYRWSTTSLLFLSVFAMLGVMLLPYGGGWLILNAIGASQSVTIEYLHLIGHIWLGIPLGIGLLLLILMSAKLGHRRHRDLARLVKEALTTDSLAHPTRSDRDIRQLT